MDAHLTHLTAALDAYMEQLSDQEKNTLFLKLTAVETLLLQALQRTPPEVLPALQDRLQGELQVLPEPIAAPIRYILSGFLKNETHR